MASANIYQPVTFRKKEGSLTTTAEALSFSSTDGSLKEGWLWLSVDKLAANKVGSTKAFVRLTFTDSSKKAVLFQFENRDKLDIAKYDFKMLMKQARKEQGQDVSNFQASMMWDDNAPLFTPTSPAIPKVSLRGKGKLPPPPPLTEEEVLVVETTPTRRRSSTKIPSKIVFDPEQSPRDYLNISARSSSTRGSRRSRSRLPPPPPALLLTPSGTPRRSSDLMPASIVLSAPSPRRRKSANDLDISTKTTPNAVRKSLTPKGTSNNQRLSRTSHHGRAIPPPPPPPPPPPFMEEFFVDDPDTTAPPLPKTIEIDFSQPNDDSKRSTTRTTAAAAANIKDDSKRSSRSSSKDERLVPFPPRLLQESRSSLYDVESASDPPTEIITQHSYSHSVESGSSSSSLLSLTPSIQCGNPKGAVVSKKSQTSTTPETTSSKEETGIGIRNIGSGIAHQRQAIEEFNIRKVAAISCILFCLTLVLVFIIIVVLNERNQSSTREREDDYYDYLRQELNNNINNGNINTNNGV